MLLLTSTSDLIQVVTDAAADIRAHASWVDNASGTITPGRTNTAAITTATTTTVVGAPAASTQRSVRHLNIRNTHGSTASTVTVQHTDGTTVEALFKVVLAAGESVVLGENGIWVYYDATGKPYMGLGPLATQAEMEAGASLATVVTPGRLHNHPGVAKFWLLAGVTGNILASYNVTSLTDTGTGVLGITIATDFSSATWCCVVAVEAPATTWAVANTREAHVRNATLAAGTVSVDCVDNTATTSLVKDPATWHVVGYGDQ
jgi:hypothetical protein